MMLNEIDRFFLKKYIQQKYINNININKPRDDLIMSK